MPLTSDLALLLDHARAEAKRRGHRVTRPEHLAAAIHTREPQRFSASLGNDFDGRLEKLLVGLKDPGGAAADAEETLALLTRATARSENPIDAVLQELRSILAVGDQPASPEAAKPADAKPDAAKDPAQKTEMKLDLTGPEPPRVPGNLRAYLTLVEPDPRIIGREGEVLQVVAALSRKTPTDLCIVGPSGSGKTALLSAVVSHLAQVKSPLAATPFWRVQAEQVVAAARANTLREIISGLDKKTADAERTPGILVFDDLDLLCILGTNSVDMDMLNVIRSVVDRKDRTAVLVLTDKQLSRLESHDPELFDAVARIVVSPLSDALVLQIVTSRAEELAAFHGVGISEGTVALAATAKRSGSRRHQPGAAIELLDAACSRASLRQDKTVRPEDLQLAGEKTRPAMDPEHLAQDLRKLVLGQDHAIDKIVSRIVLTRARLDLAPARPDGVFLFAGPTGVGKTELALALAEVVCGDRTSVIRLDMSEYAQEWALSRLIGPMPGYVGSTEPESWLTTKVRNRPVSVLLLDEFEKAHPVVWNTFLQVFDAGRLTDSKGELADFSDVIVVMTSNIGSTSFKAPKLGFAATEETSIDLDGRVFDAVRQRLAPELINRLDEVLVFHPLNRDAIGNIAVKEVNDAVRRFTERGFRLTLAPEVVQHVAESGYDPAFGARHLKRNVERLLLQPLAPKAPGGYRASVEAGSVVWKAE